VRALAHERLVADDHARLEHRAGEDDRAGADARSRADHQRPRVLALRARVGRQARALAEHDPVLDHAALTDHGPVVDRDARADRHPA
jgi:hypothetical protein